MKAIRYIRNQLAKARLRVSVANNSGKGTTPGQERCLASYDAAVVHWENMLNRRNDILARRKANREA